MIQVEPSHGFSQGTSVTYVPACIDTPLKARRTVAYAHPELIGRIVAEMQHPLRTLVRLLRGFGPKDGGTVALLTGCGRGIGCSTTALSLAVAATEECPAIVMEGDGTRRGLSARLSEVQTGWDDAVRGVRRLPWAVYELQAWPGAAILPMREPSPNIQRLLIGSRLPRLLADLRRDFDLVVLDGGAVQDAGRYWAPWVDVALLVSDATQNLAAETAAAWDLLEGKGTHVLGVVETHT